MEALSDIKQVSQSNENLVTQIDLQNLKKELSTELKNELVNEIRKNYWCNLLSVFLTTSSLEPLSCSEISFFKLIEKVWNCCVILTGVFESLAISS
jgi:hypothetical protein